MLHAYLWLLLCISTVADLIADYQQMEDKLLTFKDQRNLVLPVEISVDKSSGCRCRATKSLQAIVCFGNYECQRFPSIERRSEILKVRTTVIVRINRGDLDKYHYLTVLDIEANHKLKYIEPGAFRNLTTLQHMSISYNTALHTLNELVFEGLSSLRNLTLVNNGFTNILQLTEAFRPSLLPSLTSLDISENSFEEIPAETFLPMTGSPLKKLDVNLCRLDYIHKDSLLPLRKLDKLNIGENDLNSTVISDFLLNMKSKGINITYLDLSGMGFRKKPPRKLLADIAQTSVNWLVLADNQFEVIGNDAFPQMTNIELLDLRRVYANNIGTNSFSPAKFPNLRVLLLSGNNLPGLHSRHLSNQLLVLDLSKNSGNPITPLYFEIGSDTFLQSTNLRILNLSYNIIKAIFDYTFRGLDKLEVLNMENGTIFHVGDGTFKSMRHLEVLNLANNPLTASENLTCAQFNGLNELKYLILRNCGVRRFYDDDNIFEMMPNLTHLILRNNQLSYISAESLKPLKFLQVLDLSENLLISWWKPLFLSSGIKPLHLYLTNNKISHFSMSMIQDINFLLEDQNVTIEIDLMDNVFVCDCNAMYTTYLWLEANGSRALKEYFAVSKFQCTSPDLWEDRRVAEYLSSIKTVHCSMYAKISNLMVFVWTAPSLITFGIAIGIAIVAYKYRIYLRYWIFLAKLALGRRFIRGALKAENIIQKKGYKYDAFVSYSFEDRDFVLDMIANLEKNPPNLKLCISERDFEVGSFISEAILSSINESRYVILLISKHFVKSKWCRWETQLAEYHRLFLEDGTTYDPLVLLRLGDVEKKHLTPTLKYLLKTKIYLSWDQHNPDEFWKKLRNVIIKHK